MLDINFARREDLEAFEWDIQYIMVESPCFFGAVKPVLEQLQFIPSTNIRVIHTHTHTHRHTHTPLTKSHTQHLLCKRVTVE